MLRLPNETPNYDRVLSADPQIIVEYGDVSKLQALAQDLALGNFADLLDSQQPNKMYRVLVLSQLLNQFYQCMQLRHVAEVDQIREQLSELEREKMLQQEQQLRELESYRQQIKGLNDQIDVLRDEQRHLSENNAVASEISSVKQMQQLIAQSQISIIEAQKHQLSTMQGGTHTALQETKQDPDVQTGFMLTGAKTAPPQDKQPGQNEQQSNSQECPTPNKLADRPNSASGAFILSADEKALLQKITQQTCNSEQQHSADVAWSSGHRSPWPSNARVVKKYRHVDRYGNVTRLDRPSELVGGSLK